MPAKCDAFPSHECLGVLIIVPNQICRDLHDFRGGGGIVWRASCPSQFFSQRDTIILGLLNRL